MTISPINRFCARRRLRATSSGRYFSRRTALSTRSRVAGDGQVSRRAAFRDGLNDARRQIGKRRQEPDLALFGETTVILSSRAAAFDSMIS